MKHYLFCIVINLFFLNKTSIDIITGGSSQSNGGGPGGPGGAERNQSGGGGIGGMFEKRYADVKRPNK